MKKIICNLHEKIWGYEKWVYSPLKGLETKTEDGELSTGGPLIKIIKANQALSVQVHSDDILAKELENEDNGKTESWYILECEEGAKMGAGIRDYDEQVIRDQISNGTFEDNLIMLPSKVGDFINIPAGLVHAIGGGNKVMEVQQPSDTTYRFYDYNRKQNGKLRELHVEKAIKSTKKLTHELEPSSNDPLTYKNEVATQKFFKKPSVASQDCVVIDFESESAYHFNKGEQINFKHYSVVTW